MNDRDLRRYQRLTRIQTFGRQHADDFAPGSTARQLLSSIDQHIVDLEKAKADQRPERMDKRALLRALGDHSNSIANTARAIARHDPGFPGDYRVQKPVTENTLATQADALLAKLEDQPGDSDADKTAKTALRARFVAYELPPDFVEILRQRRENLRSANQLNQRENQDGIANTSRIGNLLTAANSDVQDLDAIMINKYSAEIETLTAWQRASRVEAAAGRPAGSTPPTAGNTPGTAPAGGGSAS
ncbi:MAG: hypothetical protein NVS9B2_30610 [Steroidobacteraceae bacterium]